MRTKILLMAGLAAMTVTVAMVVCTSHPNRSVNALVQQSVSPARPVSAARSSEALKIAAVDHSSSAQTTDDANPKVNSAFGGRGSGNDQPLVINGYAVQDPLARAALSSVGEDPDATAYWIGAINDPDLPPEERKDLIEDLNEDGLSDSTHPEQMDMPLIAARIQLIENLAPEAMDRVDLNAFAEAEKDLIGMMNGQAPQ